MAPYGMVGQDSGYRNGYEPGRADDAACKPSEPQPTLERVTSGLHGLLARLQATGDGLRSLADYVAGDLPQAAGIGGEVAPRSIGGSVGELYQVGDHFEELLKYVEQSLGRLNAAVRG